MFLARYQAAAVEELQANRRRGYRLRFAEKARSSFSITQQTRGRIVRRAADQGLRRGPKCLGTAKLREGRMGQDYDERARYLHLFALKTLLPPGVYDRQRGGNPRTLVRSRAIQIRRLDNSTMVPSTLADSKFHWSRAPRHKKPEPV